MNPTGGAVAPEGAIRFDEFMEAALYGPNSGFFATGRGAGRRHSDFITSPEVGPLFGAVFARYLDRRWVELGRPTPFDLVEAGAGRGALAIAVSAAEPECASSLRYWLVERSEALRERHGDHLSVSDSPLESGSTVPLESGSTVPLESGSTVPVASGSAKGPTNAVPRAGDVGPAFHSVRDMPARIDAGLVVANELLDNLVFRVFQKSDAGSWDEWWVAPPEDGFAPSGQTGSDLEPLLVPSSTDESDLLERLAPDALPGSAVPLQTAAHDWVRAALGRVGTGSIVVFDYCSTTAELAALDWPEWLRTFADHGRSGHPLEAPGSRDITADVCVDQLPEPHSRITQAEWLSANGIDVLLASARSHLESNPGLGDLDAIRARSTILEAEALTEPGGLGGFLVLEWSAASG